MSKKKVKKKERARARGTYTLSSRSTFLEITPKGTDLVISLRRPRESRTLDALNAMPRFNEVQRLLTAIVGGSMSDEQLPESVLVPGAEIEAMARYMAENTVEVEGLADGITWRDLADDERVDFWETLPNRGLMSCFGQLRGAVLADKNPQLLDALREQYEAKDGR